jgi:hypothetical protein
MSPLGVERMSRVHSVLTEPESEPGMPLSFGGAIAGALKKKLGLNVVSEKDEARGRVYKLPAA